MRVITPSQIPPEVPLHFNPQPDGEKTQGHKKKEHTKGVYIYINITSLFVSRI